MLKSMFDKTWNKLSSFADIEAGDELSYAKSPFYYRWMIVISVLPNEHFVGIGYNLDKHGKVSRMTYNFKDHTFYKAKYKEGQIPLADSVKEAKAREHEEEYSYLFNYARAFTRYCKTRRKGILDKFHVGKVAAQAQEDIHEHGDTESSRASYQADEGSIQQEIEAPGAVGGTTGPALPHSVSDLWNSENQVECTADGRLPLSECLRWIEGRVDDLACPDSLKNWLKTLTAEMVWNRSNNKRDHVVLSISGGPSSGKKYTSYLIAEILYQCAQTDLAKMEMLDIHDLVGDDVNGTTEKSVVKLSSLEGCTIYVNSVHTFLASETGRLALKTILEYRGSEGRHAPALILAGSTGYATSMHELRANHSFLQPHIRTGHVHEIEDYSPEMLSKLFLIFAAKDEIRCNFQTRWLADLIQASFSSDVVRKRKVGLSEAMFQAAKVNCVRRSLAELYRSEGGEATELSPDALAVLTREDVQLAIQSL